MSDQCELLIVNGSLAGRRFAVPKGGLRLGRASTSDVAIPDEELSRSHAMFERNAAGELTVLDLASANGTLVNGENIGLEVRTLRSGDRIEVGATLIQVVPEGFAGLPPPVEKVEKVEKTEVKKLPPIAEPVDLGLGGAPATGADAPAAADAGPAAPRPKVMNLVWAVAVAVFVAAIGAVLCLPSGDPAPTRATTVAPAAHEPGFVSLLYEKVEADDRHIFRYQMTIDETGLLRVLYDDVPGENRSVDKSKKLSADACKGVAKLVADAGFQSFDDEYTGASAAAENALKSWRIRLVADGGVREVRVENALGPDAFRNLCEALETFSRNELGVWALQYSREQLLELCAESERLGDVKWDEREVRFGNLFEACAAYKEAIYYLETVNPKPSNYATLKEKFEAAEKELEMRYRRQRTDADRSIKLRQWSQAREDLRILCDLVPDKGDARYVEANAKLVDVERRMKEERKGGRQ